MAKCELFLSLGVINAISKACNKYISVFFKNFIKSILTSFKVK